MAFDELSLMDGMTAEQRVLFQSHFNGVKKSGTTGVLLALFLGGIGGHHFYVGRIGLGVLYLVFVWTFIPSFVALVEAFLMGGRVDRYNARQALDIAGKVRALAPPSAAH